MTDKGIGLLKKWEGCRLQAYKDAGGILTIGYGHTKGVTPNQVITQAQAEQLLKEDLPYYEGWVDKLVEVPLTPYQKDALTLFCYNVGALNLKKSSLLRAINNHNSEDQIKACWRKWCYCKGKVLQGLKNRREAEITLYFTAYGKED